jgi:hypothetical protein
VTASVSLPDTAFAIRNSRMPNGVMALDELRACIQTEIKALLASGGFLDALPKHLFRTPRVSHESASC